MKYCFIHIPKTAGQSIQAGLKSAGVLETNGKMFGHMTLQKMVNNGLKDLNRTVSVVRNPYDRVVSVYAWALKEKHITTGMSFNDFVVIHHTNNDTNLYKKGHWFKPQLEWLQSNKGNVKHILRFETIDADFGKFCMEEKLDIILPHENVNQSKPETVYKKFYNGQTRKVIEKVYKKDFEYFGYEW